MKRFVFLAAFALACAAQVVQVTPSSTTVTRPGETVQFTASAVTGADGKQHVAWSIATPGAGLGTISQAGLYTSPLVFPAPPAGSTTTAVTIRVIDFGQFAGGMFAVGSAAIALPGPAPVQADNQVAVFPAYVAAAPGTSIQFDCRNNGAFLPVTPASPRCAAPSWSIVSGAGAIDAAGRYTAPAVLPGVPTVIIQAVDGNARAATATISLAAASPGIAGPPGPANLVTTDLNIFCNPIGVPAQNRTAPGFGDPTTIGDPANTAPCFPDGAVIGFNGFDYHPESDAVTGKLKQVIGIDQLLRPPMVWPQPKSAAGKCIQGSWAVDADWYYVCAPLPNAAGGTGPDTAWKRMPLNAW